MSNPENKATRLRVNWFKVAIIISFLSIAMMIWTGVKLYQATSYQQHLGAKTLNNDSFLGSAETPNALFANAVIYEGQGQTDEALNAYAQADAASNNQQLKSSIAFNVGNIYLNLATQLLEQQGLAAWDQAGPLVALAKEHYRKALRVKPSWSEAKYNYQLAYRLAPTRYGKRGPQRYEDDDVKQDKDPSGWPAMPGNPRGMP